MHRYTYLQTAQIILILCTYVLYYVFLHHIYEWNIFFIIKRKHNTQFFKSVIFIQENDTTKLHHYILYCYKHENRYLYTVNVVLIKRKLQVN